MEQGPEREMRTTPLSPRLGGAEGDGQGGVNFALDSRNKTRQNPCPSFSEVPVYSKCHPDVCGGANQSRGLLGLLRSEAVVRDLPLKCPSNCSFTGSLLNYFNILLNLIQI